MSGFVSQFPSRTNIAPSLQTTFTFPSPTLDASDMTSTTVEDKTKRPTACLVCRKRKLKCDSARPKCASCARLGHAWYHPSSPFQTNRQWLWGDQKEVGTKTRIREEAWTKVSNARTEACSIGKIDCNSSNTTIGLPNFGYPSPNTPWNISPSLRNHFRAWVCKYDESIFLFCESLKCWNQSQCLFNAADVPWSHPSWH